VWKQCSLMHVLKEKSSSARRAETISAIRSSRIGEDARECRHWSVLNRKRRSAVQNREQPARQGFNVGERYTGLNRDNRI
jgi:hypothetical protein